MSEERTCCTCRFKGNSVVSIPCCDCFYTTGEYNEWEPKETTPNVVDIIQLAQQCKGLVYEAKVTTDLSALGIKQTLELIERNDLSCSGCDICSPVINAIVDIKPDSRLFGTSIVQTGKLYKVQFNKQLLLEIVPYKGECHEHNSN